MLMSHLLEALLGSSEESSHCVLTYVYTRQKLENGETANDEPVKNQIKQQHLQMCGSCRCADEATEVKLTSEEKR